MDAIQIADDLAVISMAKCIGCGLCVSTCPTEAISMIHKQPDALSYVFTDDNELNEASAKDTNKAYPFE